MVNAGIARPAPMAATRWEFENRAVVIGMLFAIGFSLSAVDRRNAAVAFAAVVAPKLGIDADTAARALFFAGAAITISPRSHAPGHPPTSLPTSSTATLEDGDARRRRSVPFRSQSALSREHMLAVGIGVMASRLGFVVLNLLMLIVSFRLILREEADLASAQGDAYAGYRARVPRLLPAFAPACRLGRALAPMGKRCQERAVVLGIRTRGHHIRSDLVGAALLRDPGRQHRGAVSRIARLAHSALPDRHIYLASRRNAAAFRRSEVRVPAARVRQHEYPRALEALGLQPEPHGRSPSSERTETA